MAAREIAIVTDSTSDIPAEIQKEFDIRVVPHSLIWDENQYYDRVDIQPEEFYQKLQSGGSLPTTAQASESQFLETYLNLIKDGYQQIVVIILSHRLSGAIQSAKNAANRVNFPVHIVDSMNVSMGEGWQVLAAARMRNLGGSVSQIFEVIDRVKKGISMYVCMDTMNFLQHGGRIGDAIRLVGMVLNIKPIVRVNPESGVVEEVSISRTYQKAVNIMYEKFFQNMIPRRKIHVAVMHGNAPEEAEKLVARIKKEFNPLELITTVTGPVLGINTGPGALALAGYAEDEPGD